MIFVMPGTSQVGQLTIEALLARGTPAAGIAAGARRADAVAPGGVQTRHADYSDAPSMEAAFAGVETLILIPTKTPPAARCVEYDNAISAASKAGVKRVIFLSILTATADSVSAIAPFILFAENRTRNSGMDWAILRMGLYMEPVADWVPELLEMGCLPYPVARGRAAYVTRDDVARSLAAVAQNASWDGGVYTIAAPEAVTMPELANAISKGCGHTIPFRPCSEEAFVEICFKGNETPFITTVLLSLYRAIERDEFDVSGSDVARLTGKPAVSVDAYFQSLQNAAPQEQ